MPITVEENRLRITKFNKILFGEVISVFLFIISAFPLLANALPAFPGAEGFGSTTTGGRGGAVLFVTNTNDSGAGSLRAALTASGPRYVLFKTGGTITLSSSINITNPYVTVAGQTAPGGGILIRGPSSSTAASIYVNTHDVIIRGLRIRETNKAAIEVNADVAGSVYNVIIDHCSMSYHVDTTAGVWYNPHDVTWSWNYITEGYSPGGSAGLLIGGYNACETPGYNISVHHNLFAHDWGRNPLIKQKIGSPEIINNFVYDWVWTASRTFSTAYFAKNHYVNGPSWTGGLGIEVTNGGECPSLQTASVMVTHNIGPGRTTDTGDDWNAVQGGTSTYRTNNPPFRLSGIREDDVTTVKTKVMAGAGATVPYRDSVDLRINNEINAGTGAVPTSTAGFVWPTIASGTYPTDKDGDGIPDAWEIAQGLNPNNAADATSYAPSGYTWIEEYVNSFFSAGSPVTSRVPNAPTITAIQ